MILKKISKPFIWTKELKQVWIKEEMGIVTGHDQVAIPMRSGKIAIYDIVEVKPVYEARIDNEKKKTFYKYFSSSMSNEDVQLLEEKLIPIYEQIERNMKYSTNPAYKKEEMVKIYKISRDKEIEQKMLEKLGPAIEYYSQIKLNQQ